MNFPSFENFTMRAFEFPPWPSPTKISPFGATRTSDGMIERVRAVAGDARLAERHQDLAIRAELEHLMTLSVPVRVLPVRPFAVGDPDVAVRST